MLWNSFYFSTFAISYMTGLSLPLIRLAKILFFCSFFFIVCLDPVALYLEADESGHGGTMRCRRQVRTILLWRLPQIVPPKTDEMIESKWLPSEMLFERPKSASYISLAMLLAFFVCTGLESRNEIISDVSLAMFLAHFLVFLKDNVHCTSNESNDGVFDGIFDGRNKKRFIASDVTRFFDSMAFAMEFSMDSGRFS